MGRKSKIESLPDRNIIISRLACGDEYSGIIRDFPALTWDDLDYFARNKLPEILAKSKDLREEVQSIQGTDTLTEVRALKTRAMEILDQAQEAGDLKTALIGIREARGCLETCLKAEGQIDDRPQINITLNADWIELRTLIINALDPYPEAKEAMVLAIRGR